jgi:hypothetical protein
MKTLEEIFGQGDIKKTVADLTKKQVSRQSHQGRKGQFREIRAGDARVRGAAKISGEAYFGVYVYHADKYCLSGC